MPPCSQSFDPKSSRLRKVVSDDKRNVFLGWAYVNADNKLCKFKASNGLKWDMAPWCGRLSSKWPDRVFERKNGERWGTIEALGSDCRNVIWENLPKCDSAKIKFDKQNGKVKNTQLYGWIYDEPGDQCRLTRKNGQPYYVTKKCDSDVSDKNYTFIDGHAWGVDPTRQYDCIDPRDKPQCSRNANHLGKQGVQNDSVFYNGVEPKGTKCAFYNVPTTNPPRSMSTYEKAPKCSENATHFSRDKNTNKYWGREEKSSGGAVSISACKFVPGSGTR
jgi:hypothetical protein